MPARSTAGMCDHRHLSLFFGVYATFLSCPRRPSLAQLLSLPVDTVVAPLSFRTTIHTEAAQHTQHSTLLLLIERAIPPAATPVSFWRQEYHRQYPLHLNPTI
ncbi:hypothetical protein B0H14DRAFT_3506413 [Mycena olivaceomarginata]|nr:hypothetical protein B0H14DRAFT_3506413 [Mycena olivaceomarginata]